MKFRVMLATAALALAGLAGVSALPPAQGAAAPAQATTTFSCVAAENAVCQVPGGYIVPVSSLAKSGCGDVAAGRIGLFDYTYCMGRLNTYRVVGGEPGYRLTSAMYNKPSSVVNKTNSGWYLHDPGDCVSGTRIYIAPGQAYLYLYDQGWSNRISSITWLDRGYNCA